MEMCVIHNMILFVMVCMMRSEKIDKYVTTHINTKWRDTSIIFEVSEYLNDEDPSLFWKFVDEVSSRSSVLEASGKLKDQYEIAISIASMFLGPADIALLELSLSLRSYSAKIEMFRQMARIKMNEQSNCDNFVDIGGELACSVDEIEEVLTQSDGEPPETYDIDHFYLRKRAPNKTLILYGEMGHVAFLPIHAKLKFIAENHNINYILRHHVRNIPKAAVRLSGYGVELQMKSTEYKATDDLDVRNSDDNSVNNSTVSGEFDGINFSVMRQLYPDQHCKFDDLLNFMLEDNDGISNWKVWQFQELSIQAAQRVMNTPAHESIDTLIDISQNFPSQMKSLIKTRIKDDLRREMKFNQEIFSANLNLQPSESVLFINGFSFDVDTVDVMTILDFLRSELQTMKLLQSLGFDDSRIKKLLALDLSSRSEGLKYAIDIRDPAIIWINDIESDPRYSRWTPSLTELLRPTFPGMLRNVRRNLYNLVIIIDPLEDKSRPLISLAESLYSYSVPLRLGFILLTDTSATQTRATDIGSAIHNIFHYMLERRNPNHALSFLSSVSTLFKADKLSVKDLQKAVENMELGLDLQDFLVKSSKHKARQHIVEDFIKNSGLNEFPQALINGIPISSDHLTSDLLEEAVLSAIMSQTPSIQKAIYRGELSETDDVVGFLMNQSHVVPRLNDRILRTDGNEWLDLMRPSPPGSENREWNSPGIISWVMEKLNYLYIQQEPSQNHLYTVWIVADLSTSSGRRLLEETLDYLESNEAVRVSIIINPWDESPSRKSINLIVLATINALPAAKAIQYLRNLMQDHSIDRLIPGDFIIEDETILKQLDKQLIHLEAHKLFLNQILDLENGQRAIIHNGRLLGPLGENESFTKADFLLLEKVSHNLYGEKISKFISKELSHGEEQDSISDDVILKIISTLVPKPFIRNRFKIPYHGDSHSAVKISAKDPGAVIFDLTAIMDPVSRSAQKLGPMIKVLRETLNCNLEIFFNCIEKNSDIPLKSFFRFVFERKLRFTSDGNILGAAAKFTKLPTASLLTQNIHAPENWLVEAVSSAYDLDNIKLDEVVVGVSSIFELEYLLLEGHCFEATAGSPPRGLQITLGTAKQSMVVDTIVMANLGYFQLKANPGEWILRLRPGRSAEIYDIAHIDGSGVIQKQDCIKILISSLKTNVLKLKVKKKADKLNIDLLSEDGVKSGIWDSITRTLSNSEELRDDDEKLNIFSLASGHLYERFLKIMMLSTLKHTKSPVKFWFLKNYLSPTLKDFLPHMAKKYGFEYELVQYKWPRWLQQQVEKQRTIWGYKILFLDVLFPLDVKKIIFVDADQVVRDDLTELMKIDLNGAPYAYPPFCESRKDMDGFRFWKRGYWKNHLQGRPYHISALYVVDLKRFRRVAAGDRLRGQYQALSQDPNSLSNLDQDLPNNMIHQVAIKTLPQEWLWCETWCDDASKKYAKTIDLCNNPSTKEAKLQAAMRILPEWKDYDQEIRSLLSELDETEEDRGVEGLLNNPPERHEEL